MLIIVSFAHFAIYAPLAPALWLLVAPHRKKIAPLSSLFLLFLLRCRHPLPNNKINITTRHFAFPGIAVNMLGLQLWFKIAG